jgi:hypothetical protein
MDPAAFASRRDVTAGEQGRVAHRIAGPIDPGVLGVGGFGIGLIEDRSDYVGGAYGAAASTTAAIAVASRLASTRAIGRSIAD